MPVVVPEALYQFRPMDHIIQAGHETSMPKIQDNAKHLLKLSDPAAGLQTSWHAKHQQLHHLSSISNHHVLLPACWETYPQTHADRVENKLKERFCHISHAQQQDDCAVPSSNGCCAAC